MQVATVTATQREQSEQARMRALVRFNGSMFHSLAAASFLETAVPSHVKRLDGIFGADPDIEPWLVHAWWPQRAELGRQLHAYVEATWPEFDWNSAYRDFQEVYRPLSGLDGIRARGAREALGLCVTEAQAALFYRALARNADEPQLRALARRAACRHAEFFDFVRAYYERRKRTERVGIAATLLTATATCRSARDHDVAVAFQSLSRNWIGEPTVPAVAYSEFRQRMALSLQRHAMLGPIERLLFRPWIQRAAAEPVAPSSTRRQEHWAPATAQLAAA